MKKTFEECALLPPALRFEWVQACMALETQDDPDSAIINDLWRLYDASEPWAGLAPELAQFGYDLLKDARHHALRRFACCWLTLFPTVQTMEKLAAVALADETPGPVREQAVWSLGYRQSRRQPVSVQWEDGAIEVANTALIALAKKAIVDNKLPFENLPIALRHVNDERWFALLGENLIFFGNAIEAFADEALAWKIVSQLASIPQSHQLRAMRLAAFVLKEKVVPSFLELAAKGIVNPLELRLLAVAVSGEEQMAQLEEYLSPMKYTDDAKKRAKWHLENPGIVPTVRGLQIARTTSTMPGSERSGLCAAAADDIGVLNAFQRHPEVYLYELWAEMIKGCNDMNRARTLCTLRPEMRAALKELYLKDLARRGRAKQVVAAAQSLECVEEAAYWLAVYGKPFMALELAESSRFNNSQVGVARVLGLYRAGRPDLATRVLTEELPPSEVTDLEKMPTFPGDHEKWLSTKHPTLEPATTALVNGMDAVLALAEPAPENADSDSFNFETVGSLERWLARPIDGATVYLAGEFPGNSKEAHEKAILDRGGRLVDGPFPGTHYYVMGITCLVTTIAQLERQGTRRIQNEELGLSW